jgi:hypothetical protein
VSVLPIWVLCGSFLAAVLALIAIGAWNIHRRAQECAELITMVDARRERTRQARERLEAAHAARGGVMSPEA